MSSASRNQESEWKTVRLKGPVKDRLGEAADIEGMTYSEMVDFLLDDYGVSDRPERDIGEIREDLERMDADLDDVFDHLKEIDGRLSEVEG